LTGRPDGASFSGGTLWLRYRNTGEAFGGTISLEDRETGNRSVANVISLRLEPTGSDEAELALPLPATPGLTGLRRVVLLGGGGNGGSVDLQWLRLRFVPDPPGMQAP